MLHDWRPTGPVLIVEDAADVRDVLAYHLRRDGYDVVTAMNGDDGMSQLHAGLRPCLIVLDLAMPVKDGFAFRREQRAHPHLKDIPVIIYSQQYDARTHAAALDAIPTPTSEGIADIDSLSRLVRAHCLKVMM